MQTVVITKVFEEFSIFFFKFSSEASPLCLIRSVYEPKHVAGNTTNNSNKLRVVNDCKII
jgi:hypothetical protein